MRLIPLVCLLPAIALAATPAAAQKAAARKKPAPAAHKSAAGPDLPSHLPASASVATVDGEAIPLSTYVDRLSLRFGPDVREMLIEETLLRQEAKRRKIAVTAAELDGMVQRTYDDSVRRFGDEKGLAAELSRTRGWSLPDYKIVIRDQAEIPLLRGKIAAALVSGEAVKDAEIQKQYDEHKEAFTVPDAVRVSHILVKRPAEGAGEADAAAKAKAEALLKRVSQNGGANFAAVAKEASEDAATAAGGGKIPVELSRGANPFGAAFEAIVFNAPTGLIAQVIPAPDGYHIVRVDSAKPARLLPLAEVKEQIRTSLLSARRDQAMEQLLVKLRTGAKISTGKF